jgi:hypothetical protein
MSHTPGPWTYVDCDDVITAIDGPVCSLQDCYNSPANSRLITAAPDLLKDLKSCMRRVEDLGALVQNLTGVTDLTGAEILGHARQTLARVEGKT